MGSHRDGGWEDSCHQNAVQGAPGTRVWPASCWVVCLHLDIPRAPKGLQPHCQPQQQPAPGLVSLSLPWDPSINKCPRRHQRWVRGGVPRGENDTLE